MPGELLPDKVIFITGGGQGIGRECALAYAAEGAHVAIADIDLAHAETTVSELPGNAFAVWCDVGDAKSVEDALKVTLDHYGRIDAVHNNAGISQPSKPLHETMEAVFLLSDRARFITGTILPVSGGAELGYRR